MMDYYRPKQVLRESSSTVAQTSTYPGSNRFCFPEAGPKWKCCPYTVAAEQKARLTYDNILRMSDDPDVTDAIRFLRAREIVHFQRFGEALRLVKDRLDEKNVYYMNPSFDQ